MKLMLAGFDNGATKRSVPDLICLSKYILCSFWFLKKGMFNELEQLIIQRNNTDDFLLDSGAFSMFSQKNHDLNTYIDDYIHFINEYNIKRYIELDIDPVVGYEEVKNIRRYIEEKTNKKSIPVWHKNRGMDEWLKHITDYDYVAIGGLVTKEIAPSEYNSLKPMVKLATNHNTKVHGLGFTGQDCYKYGFYSVDSTSWASGRRFGQAVKFTNNKITNIKKPKDARANYITVDRNNLIEWCKFQRYCETKKS